MYHKLGAIYIHFEIEAVSVLTAKFQLNLQNPPPTLNLGQKEYAHSGIILKGNTTMKSSKIFYIHSAIIIFFCCAFPSRNDVHEGLCGSADCS